MCVVSKVRIIPENKNHRLDWQIIIRWKQSSQIDADCGIISS